MHIRVHAAESECPIQRQSLGYREQHGKSLEAGVEENERTSTTLRIAVELAAEWGSLAGFTNVVVDLYHYRKGDDTITVSVHKRENWARAS